MIVFCGGGTGGHLSIVDSVADYVDDKIYIGSQNGQDRAWFENDSRFAKRVFLQTTGVVNKKGLGKIRALWLLLQAVFKASYYVRKSDAVFSVGGFSAAPAAIAAIICFKPLYIHEQNSVTGRLNRLLKPFAKRFIPSFGKAREPYPVKQRFFQLQRKRQKLQTVIFLGGSQGAKAINDFALEVAKVYDFKIIHQCGEKDFKRVAQAYKQLGKDDVELFAFSRDLAAQMHKADLAVARAGASTLWELCANALPALFVPYPYAAANHQFFNAKTIVDMELGWVMPQKELKIDFFTTLTDKELEQKSSGLLHSIEQEGAKKIASYLTR